MRNMTIKRLFVLTLILFLSVGAPYRQASVAKGASTNEESSVMLNVTSKSLVKDTSFALKVYNLQDNQKAVFKSASSGIASVDKEGVITAKKIGTTTINVSVREGFKTVETLQCDIVVGPPAISIKLTKSAITLTPDSKISLKPILKPNNTVEEPRFTSSNPSVAVVNTSGRVTAKAVGEAYIFASIGDNKCDFCLVTVVEEEPSVDTEKNAAD